MHFPFIERTSSACRAHLNNAVHLIQKLTVAVFFQPTLEHVSNSVHFLLSRLNKSVPCVNKYPPPPNPPLHLPSVELY